MQDNKPYEFQFYFILFVVDGRVMGEAITRPMWYRQLEGFADILHRTIGKNHYHTGWIGEGMTAAKADFFIKQFQDGKVTNLSIKVE